MPIHGFLNNINGVIGEMVIKQEEKEMKFKVGDKVRVREGLIAGKKYNNGCNFVKEMETCKGKEFIVRETKSVCGSSWYRLKGVKYYSFSDDMLEPVEFTIDDVQVNDIVEFRDGGMHIVHEFGNELFCVEDNGYMPLRRYNYDFKIRSMFSHMDIMCVRRPEAPWQLKRESWGEAPILWERKEPYDGKSFSELFEEQWNWLADNPEKSKADWFEKFYPDEERIKDDCFACQHNLEAGEVYTCEKCPICKRKALLGCLNGLYDAWYNAKHDGNFEIASNIARCIANLKWEEK